MVTHHATALQQQVNDVRRSTENVPAYAKLPSFKEAEQMHHAVVVDMIAKTKQMVI